MSESALPIDALRGAFEEARGAGPVVITAPTGSGKSTQVPRWCAAGEGAEVLVVEPRRVACRALAQRVAELEGSPLGERVGYQVRDEVRRSEATRLRFVTPGIALRQMEAVRAARCVVLDELHERRLDVDLLLALLRDAGVPLVAMSATMDGDRVAAHLGGTHLRAEGRLHPVSIRYRAEEGRTLPTDRDLERRVAQALDAVADDPGDVLVFLPGKGEIGSVQQVLGGRRDLELVPLHGGLSLKEQSRAFAPSKRRKVILATNVAETSLTVPGIGVVIDAGLVRRTTYHQGRAHLALLPIAQDAADQRAGRAGRTGPGVAVRLWARRAPLDEATPPEVHRESLVPLVLAAAAAGQPSVEALPFLDPPKEHALATAREELRALGALEEGGELSALGRELHGLPLDPHLGRLLLEARRAGDADLLQDAVDLVAALATDRAIFRGPPKRDDRLRRERCDACGMIRALREGHADDPLNAYPLGEARRWAKRLRKGLGLKAPVAGGSLDPVALRRLALRADPRAGYVARRRKRHVAFANGGPEVQLGRESAVGPRLEPQPGEDPIEALVVFDVRAFGQGRDRRLIATCASEAKLAELRDAGLGRPRLGKVKKKGGKVLAEVERVHAGKVLDVREEVPRGEAAREAIATLFLRGSLFREALEATKERLEARRLAAQLSQSHLGAQHGLPEMQEPPALEDWVRARIAELGVESGAALGLLAPEDLTAEPLDYAIQHVLDGAFPRRVDLGDALYAVHYDLPKRHVVLRLIKGSREKPPPLSFLPSFPGFRISVEAGRSLHVVRSRG